jgi:hypothetical protein
VKRLLIILLLGLAICAGAFFALRDHFAEKAAWRVLRDVEAMAARPGVQLGQLRMESVRMIGLDTIVCSGLSGTVRLGDASILPGVAAAGGHGSVAFEVGRVVVSVTEVWDSVVRVSIDNGSVVFFDAGGRPDGRRVTGILSAATFDFSWNEPTVAVRDALAELRSLMRDGECRLAGSFAGQARFPVGSRWYEAGLHSEIRGTRFAIVLDREAVRRISKVYTHQLTEAEIELVATSPQRAPLLLKLAEQAANAADELKGRDRTYPFDAYRHVYWSWLLTREFGPEYAQRVTDAHEIGPTYETGTASRRMDLHNNAVGRAFALAGVPESELVDRARHDANVQRKP